MKKEIEKRAALLLNRVLDRYRSRSRWDRRSLSMMLDEELADYNADVRRVMEPMIYDRLRDVYAGEALPDVIPTPPELSAMLHRNAKHVRLSVAEILLDHYKSKAAAGELAMKLYEGYGFNDNETLEVVKKMPRYIQKELTRPSVSRRVWKQVSKLRTKPLRAAYAQVIDAVENERWAAVKKKSKVALEEKARYYANRIAQTETQRSINLARAKKYLEDEEVEFVKYEMSGKHPMVDICDYYANLDVGYGKGIVPKEQMIALPLHPHCMCRYRPYYRRVKKRMIKNPERETLKRFTKWERSRILGSYDALRRWESGESAESIFNAARPRYPIVKALAVFATKQGKPVFDENIITQKEKEAIVSWTVDSSEIKKVMWGISEDEKAKQFANTLFALFDKYDSNLKKGVKLYRGMSFTKDDFKYYGYDKIKKNEIHIPDTNAIVSFSTERKRAFEYAAMVNREYKVVYILENETEALDISKISAKPEEKESIITKGKEYLVTYTRIFNRGGEIWKVIKLKKEE